MINFAKKFVEYMNTVFLLIGGNMGDRLTQLITATKLIQDKVGIILKSSSIYESAPWGNTNQSKFLNQVLEIDTILKPFELLVHLLNIENIMGRNRVEKWGERNIDIDILFYNDDIINAPHLTVPHPHLHERRFTLVPLLEIAPHLIHPISKLNVSTMLATCKDALHVDIYKA
jgi:2-amino-4-hydroxy-6-hydroxymethyldihydropteridine diphosphokinase